MFEQRIKDGLAPEDTIPVCMIKEFLRQCPTLADKLIVALRPVMNLPQDVYDRIASIHNSLRGHVGLKLCKHRFKEIHEHVAGKEEHQFVPDDGIPS